MTNGTITSLISKKDRQCKGQKKKNIKINNGKLNTRQNTND